MELERKIEKLLRAYAKKRRADVDDAFTLPPATRRILQNEAARLAPKPEDEDEALTLWELFRRRWAVLLGFALIIFFGAALFLPALSKAKMKAPKVLAMNQNKDRELPTAGAESAKPAAPPVVMAESDSRKPAVSSELAGTRREVAAQSQLADNRPVPATAPAMAMGSFDQPAHGFGGGGGGGAPAPGSSTATVSGGTLVLGIGGEKNGEVSGAVAGLPAAAPTVAPVPAVPADGSAVAQNSFAFKSLAQSNATTFGLNNNNSQRFVQAAAAQTKPPPVLASFEVQQNGNAISVVDRDGSIYNGTLQPVETTVQDELAKTKEVADKSAVVLDAAKKDAFLAGNAGNVQSQAQNYFFRVSGANRSLKQNVVFTGNLIAISNATTNAATNATQKFSNQNAGASGGQFQSANGNASQALLFNNSRIAGTVTLDDTNKIEINAMPVTP